MDFYEDQFHGEGQAWLHITAPRAGPDTQLLGEEVDITVAVRAQPAEGTSQAHWKMVDEHDWEFFPDRYPHGLMLSIVVHNSGL